MPPSVVTPQRDEGSNKNRPVGPGVKAVGEHVYSVAAESEALHGEFTVNPQVTLETEDLSGVVERRNLVVGDPLIGKGVYARSAAGQDEFTPGVELRGQNAPFAVAHIGAFGPHAVVKYWPYLPSGKSASVASGRSCQESTFPIALASLAPLHIGRQRNNGDDQAVQPRNRCSQRPDHVDEQHDAPVVGVIPRPMRIGVVEEEALTLPPVSYHTTDLDTAAVGGIRHEQTEVISQDPPVRAAKSGIRLCGERMENIAVVMPGIASTIRAVSGQQAQFPCARTP